MKRDFLLFSCSPDAAPLLLRPFAPLLRLCCRFAQLLVSVIGARDLKENIKLLVKLLSLSVNVTNPATSIGSGLNFSTRHKTKLVVKVEFIAFA